MRVELYSAAITGPSFTHNQKPPSSFSYVSPFSQADCALASDDSAEVLLRSVPNGRRKILWLQESRWLTRPQARIPSGFDLVLSNQKEYCERGARYMTLFGTWVQPAEYGRKTKQVSMVASRKNVAPGHRLRHQVAYIVRGYDGYGPLFNHPIEDKSFALVSYRFSIAVESENYAWWHTEKLWDCFAARCVPLYWGCRDTEKLVEWGFEPSGILFWDTPEELQALIEQADEDLYESLMPAIDRNFQRAWELYCAEVALMEVIREP